MKEANTRMKWNKARTGPESAAMFFNTFLEKAEKGSKGQKGSKDCLRLLKLLLSSNSYRKDQKAKKLYK